MGTAIPLARIVVTGDPFLNSQKWTKSESILFPKRNSYISKTLDYGPEMAGIKIALSV
jgi:hypothetical protein